MSLFKLFLIYVKIGAILLGGGYVILPIMTSEFVKPIFQYYYQDDIDYRKLHMFTNEDIGKVAFFTEEEAKTNVKGSVS